MYQALALAEWNEFYDDLDADHAFESFFEERDLWDWGEQADYASSPRQVKPRTVRGKFGRALGGQPLAVGEIVPQGKSEERGLGQLVKRKQEGYTRGRRALVTYDRRGNVYMQVYTAAMNPTSAPFRIGAVTTRNLPSTQSQRGVAIENRIRGLVERATGIAFHSKLGNARGADLVPNRNRKVGQSRRGVGGVRFDSFDALSHADGYY